MPQKKTISPTKPRPLVDRLVLRAPFVTDRALYVVRKLAPGSAIRRRLITWTLRRGFAAHDRKDVEFTLFPYDDEVSISLLGAAGLGLAEHYAGHQGWYEFLDDLYETFDDAQYRVKRVLDAGDRVVFEFEFTGIGKASGAKTTLNVGTILYLARTGKIARQILFWQDGWKHALEDAGLSE